MISDLIDELLQIAAAQGCTFEQDFKQMTIEKMIRPTDTHSIMYQDFTAKRPMEVETYLGSPIKLAQDTGIRVPRIETIYALLHHCNIINQQRPAAVPISPHPMSGPTPPPRIGSAPPPRGPVNGLVPPYINGNGMHSARGGRVPSMGPPMRRGPPPVNGYPPRSSVGYNPRGPPHPNQLSRRPSFEGNDLEEFSHLVLYDDIPEGGVAPDIGNSTVLNPSELALRERELNVRQKELQLREREQEYNLRRGPRRPPPSHRGGFDDDDDDDDDFFDPVPGRGPPQPPIDPDNFDMMSITSRRNRKAPSLGQMRKDPEAGPVGRSSGMRQSHSYGARPGVMRNRSSAQLMANVPGMHDSLMDNPMMGYSSNRYGAVDRKTMNDDSRANSLTAARLNELQGPSGTSGMNGAYPSPNMPRRTSQSPGNLFNPGQKQSRRPSPPGDGYVASNGTQATDRPSPPTMMPQPVPRHPPGQGNAVAPQQVEQHAGVSNLYPPKGPIQNGVRSLTGSASASAGSGDSGASGHIDSENSAHSSQSSLGPRHTARYQGHAVSVR